MLSAEGRLTNRIADNARGSASDECRLTDSINGHFISESFVSNEQHENNQYRYCDESFHTISSQTEHHRPGLTHL